MKDTEAAFRWIVGILQTHGVRFEISGGLAARVYGATRPLVDIDIIIPEESVPMFFAEVKPYVISGPGRFRDDEWDVFLLALEYKGQQIDLSGVAGVRVFDPKKKVWIALSEEFSDASMRNVYGIEVPVLNREQLIAEKTILGREVDVIDLAQMKAAEDARQDS